MAKTFEEMLAELHSDGLASLNESNDFIEVDLQRKFIVQENYDTVLAYEGDINSQIVSFKLPLKHEDHDLSSCNYKKIRWKNLASGTEGINSLTILEYDTANLFLQWVVPPEAFVKAGIIEISISFYDFDKSGNVGFAWNTPPFRGLSVGESSQQVGFDLFPDNPIKKTPAKNEILFVDIESKNIVAPSDYNFTIGNYYDFGTVIVHFQIPRYVHGLDLLEAYATEKDTDGNEYPTGSVINIVGNYTKNDVTKKFQYFIPNEQIYSYASESSYGEGLVNFYWKLPQELLSEPDITDAIISISIVIGGAETKKVTDKDGKTLIYKIPKMWSTNPFNRLKIGGGIFFLNGKDGETLPIVVGRQYEISGNLTESEAGDFDPIAGIITLRDNVKNDLEQNPIKENEMVVYYNNDTFDSVRVGIKTEEGVFEQIVGHTNNQLETFMANFLTTKQFIIDANLEPIQNGIELIPTITQFGTTPIVIQHSFKNGENTYLLSRTAASNTAIIGFGSRIKEDGQYKIEYNFLNTEEELRLKLQLWEGKDYTEIEPFEPGQVTEIKLTSGQELSILTSVPNAWFGENTITLKLIKIN